MSLPTADLSFGYEQAVVANTILPANGR